MNYFWTDLVSGTSPLWDNATTTKGLRILSVYPQSQPQSVGGSPGRLCVSLLNQPDAILSDARFPMVQANDTSTPTSFTAYQNAMRAAHDITLASFTVPVIVGATSVNVPANKVYQDYLAGVAAECAAGASSVSVVFRGKTITGTAAQFLAAYKNYRVGLRNVNAIDHITIRGLIESASVLSDLDAISWL